MARLKIGNQTGTLVIHIPYTYEDNTVNNFMPVMDDFGDIEPIVDTSGAVYENNDIIHITSDNWAPLNNIKSVEFPDLVTISGNSILESAYSHMSKIESFSAPNLKYIKGERACAYLFDMNGDNECNMVTPPYMPLLEEIDGRSAAYYMFSCVDSMEGILDLHSLRLIRGYYAANWMFYKCKLDGLDFSSLEIIDGDNCCSSMFNGNRFQGAEISFPKLRYLSGDRCMYQMFMSTGVKRFNFSGLKEIHGTAGTRYFENFKSSYLDDVNCGDTEFNFDVLETVYDYTWKSSKGMFSNMAGSSNYQRKVWLPSLKNVTASYSMSNTKHPFYNIFSTANTSNPHEIHFPKKLSSSTFANRTIGNCTKLFDIVTEIIVNGVSYNRDESQVVRDSNYHKTALCFVDENENKVYFPCEDTYENKTQPAVGNEIFSDKNCTLSAGFIIEIA